jgi:hypothetical protein
VGKRYTPEELAVLAAETAQEVGVEVLRWWLNEDDPRELYVEARTQNGILVVLVAILPE